VPLSSALKHCSVSETGRVWFKFRDSDMIMSVWFQTNHSRLRNLTNQRREALT